MTALDAAAASALAAWGGGRVVPVTQRENAVYRADLADGRVGALRLHRPGYQSEAAILSELAWCRMLAAREFPCPVPVPTRAGGWLARAGERRASLVTWIDGVPFGAAGVALAGTVAAQAVDFAAIGRLLARLHALTDGLVLPSDFDRPSWDAEGLLGDAPLWGRFWENPALSGTESAELLAVRAAAAAALAEQRAVGADFGLVHADVLRENLLRTADGGFWLIDFDDCGSGFRLYDLATALSQSVEEPALPRLARALLEGYAETRVLPEDAGRALTLFVMLRCFASCGWLIARVPADHPRMRPAAERALRLARLWRGGGDVTGPG